VRDDRDGRNESAFTRVVAALLPGLDQTLRMSLALIVCFLVAPVASARAAEPVQQLSSAAEETWFRSACTTLGEQILAANFISSAVYQEQVSRYSPRTSRCYVEMRVQTLDRDEHLDRFGRFLYDGQTKELLAFAQIKDGKKSGRVFDLNHRTISFANAGWDDASDYIYTTMIDDE
jgi:hypothetical protein